MLHRLLACIRALVPVVAIGLLPVAGLSPPALAQGTTKGPSGLPVPRFVSLKSDAVNVRRGPSREHDVVWRYVRAGLPVEVTQEFENWRRIRDFEGAEGWVFHSLLTGVRTALVAPWDKSGTAMNLYADASENARVTAMVEPGVQATVPECTGTWCHLKGKTFEGWIAQQSLWGVYPNETFD